MLHSRYVLIELSLRNSLRVDRELWVEEIDGAPTLTLMWDDRLESRVGASHALNGSKSKHGIRCRAAHRLHV